MEYDYENLDSGQRRAYNYMQDLVRGGYTPGLEVLPRVALLKGYPVQDVLAATLSMMNGGNLVPLPMPDALREAFVRHVRQMKYVPSPIDTAHVVMTPQMQAVVDAAARAIHENSRERRTAEGLTAADNPLLRPWEDLSPEERASTLSTAEDAVKAIAALGGVSAADLDFRRTRDELRARLDEHVHDVWAQNKVAAGVRYGVERTEDAEGRDITHPDLVPFKDMSESFKGTDQYGVAVNDIILDTIHKENLSIAPQVKDDIVIDTSHVKMTDALREAAEKVAKTEHAMHLEAEPFEESPVMKPWKDLDPADRQMMLDEAGKKLMLVAAIGGLSPETFEDKESFGEICDTLDDFVMGQNHRTDRELVHEENEAFLQAVEASGIVVEAQMSRDVEDMEWKMRDAFRKEPALEPELPGAAEKTARILAGVRLYELGSAPRPGAALPPEDHLAADENAFDAAEGAILRCAEGFTCPKDTLVETPEGNFVCIIPKGAEFMADDFGNLDMSPFESVGSVDLRDFECRQACLKAIHGMLSENGYKIDPLALKDPDYPMTLDNLHDDALAGRLLSDARREVKALQEQGFVMVPGYADGYPSPGDVLSGNLGRLLAEGPLDGRSVDALSRAGLWVSYAGSDEAVNRAIHDDRAEKKREDRRFMVRNDPKSEEREWSTARNEISYLFMEGHDRPVSTPEDLARRAAAFTEKMKDPLSKESVLMDSLPRHGDRAAQVAEAFRVSSWMAMTGCSYNDAMAMTALPKERFRLPQGAVAAVERYKKEKAEYDKKNFVAKLFSREPKMDRVNLDSLVDKLNEMERDWKTYSAIEGAFAGTGLLGEGSEYLDGIRTVLSNTSALLHDALYGVPGMDDAVARAAGICGEARQGLQEGHAARQDYDGPAEQKGDIRALREYGIPEETIAQVLREGAAEFKGMTHNRPSTETSPADPRLDVKTSMRLELSGGRIVVKDPVGRDIKVGDFLKMGYRDLLATKKEAYAGLEHGARLPSDANEKTYKMPPYKQGKWAASAKKQHQQDQDSDDQTKKGPKIK